MDIADQPIPSRWIPAPTGRSGAPARPRPRIVWAPASPAYTPVCPLWSRLFDAVPLSPILVGALVGAALALAFFALDVHDGNVTSLLRGEVAPWRHVEVRSAVIVAALLAGVLVTHRYEELGTRRDVEKLAPQLSDLALRSAAADDAPVAHRSVSLRLAGVLGAVLLLALVPTLYLDPSRFLHAATYALPSVLFDLAVGAVLGWTSFKTLFAALEQDRRFAGLARHLRAIDLLDLSPLYVFGRRGLRRALRWLLLVSIASLVFVDAGRAMPPALVLCAIFGVASLSFLLPVWGVQRTIRAEKRRELASLRSRIVEERRRLRAASWRPVEAGGRFADLLAYEARVSAARTWPFDGSTLVRLALYGCLPLGSWLGSALLQHVVEVWLR